MPVILTVTKTRLKDPRCKQNKNLYIFFIYRPLMGGLLLMMAILPSSIAFYRVQQRRDLEWRRRLWSATARWRSRMFQEKYLMPPVAIEINLFGIQFFFSLFIWYFYLLFIPSVLVIENVRNKNNAIVIVI